MKKFLQFFDKNLSKIVLLLFVFYGLELLAGLPYFNLIFGNFLIVGPFLSILIFFLFRPALKYTVILIFLLLTLEVVFALLGGPGNLIEQLGNAIYGLMILGFLQYLF